MRYFINGPNLLLNNGQVFTLSRPWEVAKGPDGAVLLDDHGSPKLLPKPDMDFSVCGWMEHLIETLPQGCGLTTKQWGWAYRALGVCSKVGVGEVVAMEDADYEGFMTLMYDDVIGELIAARFEKPWKGAFAPNYLRMGAIALYQILEQAQKEPIQPLIVGAPLGGNGVKGADLLPEAVP